MVQCVVLDGWHKGHVVALASAPPTLRLYRPTVVTRCECNGDGGADDYTYDAGANEYKRCMGAVDGQVAAYSVKGDSEALLNGRDWVTSAKRDAWIERKPLYWDHVLDVSCRDERAWPDSKGQ